MSIEYEALKNIFCNFHRIDNIPEDQKARDKICLKVKSTLLMKFFV